MDPFSKESLVAWLKTKPPTKEYAYDSIYNCALAQYYQSVLNDPKITVGNSSIRSGMKYYEEQIPSDFNSAAEAEPCTFGAMLERLEA